MKIHSVCRWSKLLLVFSAMLLIADGLPRTAAADDAGQVSSKLKRQIRLMETVIDETLLDSPNLLVFSNSPTQGIYLDDYGVIFTIEASLVSDNFFFGGDEAFSVLRDIRIGTEDGRVVIFSGDHDRDDDGEPHRYRARIREDGDWDIDEDEDADEDDDSDLDEDEDWDADIDEDDDIIIDFFGSDAKSVREMRREKAERARESYEEGKQELIEVLIGYGDSMTRLEDDQWIVVAAFLKQDDFFDDEGISRLILKARMSDLRDFGREHISADEMAGRVALEEY